MQKSINTRTKYVLVGSDFSQQEPRLLSHYSQDDNMITAYKQGKDLYATIAMGIYKMSYWECMEHNEDGSANPEGKKRRQSVKAVLLGIMYGRGAAAIAEQVNCSLDEAKQIVANFYKAFPKVKVWMDKLQQELKEKEYVEDFCGRRRRLPDINLPAYKVSRIKPITSFNPFLVCKDKEVVDDLVIKWQNEVTSKVANSQLAQKQRIAKLNIEHKQKGEPLETYVENDEMSNQQYEKLAKAAAKEGIRIEAFTGRRAQAERQCVNSAIQGGAASMTKVAMNKIFKDPELNSYGFKIAIGVHDELIGEVKAVYAQQCADRLCEVMKTCVSDVVTIPFKCDPAIEYVWYESEMAHQLQSEKSKLLASGKTEEEIMKQFSEVYCEFLPEQLDYLLNLED